jgi:Txe/YoeB family toxin of Txe-Axe toxin-antitoxin module
MAVPLDSEHRLVHRVAGANLLVLQVRYHY